MKRNFITILEAIEEARNIYEAVLFNSNDKDQHMILLSDLDEQNDLDYEAITKKGQYEITDQDELIETSNDFDIKTICTFYKEAKLEKRLLELLEMEVLNQEQFDELEAHPQVTATDNLGYGSHYPSCNLIEITIENGKTFDVYVNFEY